MKLFRWAPVVFGLVLVPFTASAVDVLMPSRVGLVRFGEQTGILKSQKSISKPLKGTSFAVPTAGGADDPRVVGGTWRRCIIGQAGPCDTIDLDPSQWIGLGKPAGKKGWRYRGFGGPTDPCTSVVLKSNVLRVVCKGEGGIDDDFVLPVAPSSVGDELIIGSMRYCNRWDPPYSKDGDTQAMWRKKVHKQDIAPPAVCPDLGGGGIPYGSASQAFVAPPASLLK